MRPRTPDTDRSLHGCKRPNGGRRGTIHRRLIADIRRLRHIGAMDPMWRAKAGRELLAVAGISLIVLGYLGVVWQTRPPRLMSGRITGLGLVEQEGYGRVGSVARATVAISEGREVSVPLPDGSLCRVGSQIEVEELHTLFGSRFAAGLRECSASALSYAKPEAAFR